MPASLADCLFDWAQNNYSALFAPAAQSAEIDLGPAHYRFRYYSATRAYLGSANDGNVYYLAAGVAEPMNVGALSTWLGTAGCR